ncbi:MAG: ribosomal-processing cysteine protease Prp [Syntrophomonadaceae bacterium]|nr:ribosomal-processing cysteine protease Prp [Syntrophomonadaceae bacterium]
MIRVEVQRNPGGEITTLRVKGHAGYGVRGQDIVCAGVSALTQSALLGLQRFLAGDVQLELAEGLLQVVLPERLSPEERNNASVILETVMLGIEHIALNYPRNIRIVDRVKKKN